MSATYLTFMQDDIRAIQISVRDQFDNAYILSAATYKVYSSVINHHGGDILIPESPAMVVGNTASILMDTTITSAAGEYDIVWKLIKTVGTSTYEYHHKTNLRVEEII